jgi:glucuronate isomerase
VVAADSALALHPDRLLPVDPTERDIARRLYAAVRALPIISPHGHVDPTLLLDDAPFPDPATLLVTPDHYVTRLLHADGVGLDELGVGWGPLGADAARAVWRRLCERWHLFRGTPVRFWLEAELAEIFGVSLRPSAGTADVIYDQIAERLADDAYRPRALYERFGITLLATTDDPCSDLAAHAALAADPTWPGRVVPTFRPDRYLEPGQAGWDDAVARLGAAAGVDTGAYHGYVQALEQRRRHFVAHGATSADHSHDDVRTDPLAGGEAARIYDAALAGRATADEATAFRRHMLLEMARMSCDDGLVMTLHPGVRRNHHRPTGARFGPDTGHDIPLRLELTDALRPLLERFGTHPGFHLVVFTVDEGVWSRELAPLAGFYPSVYAGVPWWFLDAPDAMRRFREAVTETAGFTRTSGFVDDTRAFCSIPARHDMARRVDAGFLARLVAEHRLAEDEALETAVDLVIGRPTAVFKL